MNEVDVIGPIEKSPRGLREAMFNELETLQAGFTSITRARSVGKLAEEIHKSLKLEIEAQKSIEDSAFAAAVAIANNEDQGDV